jgi:hypothetical protein
MPHEELIALSEYELRDLLLERGVREDDLESKSELADRLLAACGDFAAIAAASGDVASQQRPTAPPDSPNRPAKRPGFFRRLTKSSSKRRGAQFVTCGICEENIDGKEGRVSAAGPCAHVYCSKCLKRWVRDHGTCPMCRREFGVGQVTLFRPRL